jgi:hypothetical protein
MLESLDKRDLGNLAAGLGFPSSAHNERYTIEACIEFVLAETKGLWHGRARACMCRRLKHCALSPEQQRQIVDCITTRLATGKFSEQFRDQLRLALQLDAKRTLEVAHQCLAAPKEYIRRLAGWVVNHEDSRARSGVVRAPQLMP